MTPRLATALTSLAKMRAPSVVHLLTRYGFHYEAGVVSEVIRAYEESTQHTSTDAQRSDEPSDISMEYEGG